MSKRHNYGCACRTCAIERKQLKPSAKPLWKIAQEITDSIPPEEWAKLEPGVYDVNDALDKLKVARVERDSARRFAKAWHTLTGRLFRSRNHCLVIANDALKDISALQAENAALKAEVERFKAERAAELAKRKAAMEKHAEFARKQLASVDEAIERFRKGELPSAKGYYLDGEWVWLYNPRNDKGER